MSVGYLTESGLRSDIAFLALQETTLLDLNSSWEHYLSQQRIACGELSIITDRRATAKPSGFHGSARSIHLSHARFMQCLWAANAKSVKPSSAGQRQKPLPNIRYSLSVIE